jgi:hypothetical protein
MPENNPIVNYPQVTIPKLLQQAGYQTSSAEFRNGKGFAFAEPLARIRYKN